MVAKRKRADDALERLRAMARRGEVTRHKPSGDGALPMIVLARPVKDLQAIIRASKRF